MKSVVLFGAMLWLGACQMYWIGDETSPYYAPPVGSKLILKNDFLVPAHALKVYIQGGRLAQDAGRMRPYCVFELRDRDRIPQTVQADTFVLTRVYREIDYIARIDRSPLLYVDLVVPNEGGQGPGLVTYATVMQLQSPRQPNVLRLSCARLQDYAPESQHLSIAQIRAALGSLFRLELAQPK